MNKKNYIFFDSSKDFEEIFSLEEQKVLKNIYKIHTIRKFRDLVFWIKDNGLPNFINFNCQLTEYFCKNFLKDIKLYNLSSKIEYTSFTGKEVMEWLIEYCFDNKLKFPEYKIRPDCKIKNEIEKMIRLKVFSLKLT